MKIKVKKIPKPIRKALGIKGKYIDLEDLFELAIKLVSRLLGGSGKRSAAAPLSDGERRAEPVLAERPLTQVPVKPIAASQLETVGAVQEARRYQREISQLRQTAVSEFEQMRLDQLAELVNEWVTAVVDLAQRVMAFEQNKLVQEDLTKVPKAIASVEKRLEKTDNELVRQELTKTLQNRQQQLASLQKLAGLMELADVKMENTVSMLGTMYSQLLISRSKGQVADYGRLLDEANEAVHSLQDHLHALEEIKFNNRLAHE